MILWTSYWYGFHWPGKACLNCGVIVDGKDPYEDEDSDWPHDGYPVHDALGAGI